MKNNLMKRIALLATLLIGAASLSACGNSGSATQAPAPAETKAEEAGTEAAAPEEEAAAVESDWEGAEIAAGLTGELTYMHSGDDYEREMYAGVFDSYMKYAPGVTVTQMYVPSDYYTKLQTLAAAGSLPDLFWTSESSVSMYEEAGMLADQNAYLEQYPQLTEDIIDGVLEFGNINGKQVAFPKDWTSYVMFINKDMFTEQGVEIPTNDWTAEEYREIAKQLTVKSEDGSRVDVYGTAINNYRADWINWMGNYGAEWFKDGKANLSSAEALQGLHVMYDVIQDGSAPSPGSVSSTGDSEDRLFIIGKVAMYPTGRWGIPSFRAECDFEWDALEMPKGTTRSCPFICSMVCIAETSENKDAAANLLSYQMSDEGLLQVMGSALSLPVYNDLMANENYVNCPPSAEAFINSAAYLGSKSQLDVALSGSWSEFNSIVNANLSDAFEGICTIEEAAQKIDEQCNTTLFTE